MAAIALLIIFVRYFYNIQTPDQHVISETPIASREPIIQEIPSPRLQETPSPTPVATAEPLQYNKYTISLDIDPVSRIVKGVQKVSFRNKSYESMSSVCFNVYSNAFRKNAEYQPYFQNFENRIFSRGKDYSTMQIVSVTVQNSDLKFKLEDTALEIMLEQPLPPDDVIEIGIQFEAYIPEISHRTGANDKAIWCGNFLPTLAVYESGKWCTNPYYKAGDPFYSEVANYLVNITTPLDYTVAATGPFTIQELDGKKITSYTTKLVRDFAFAISKDFKVASTTNKNGTDISLYYYSDVTQKRIDELLKCAGESLEYFSQELCTYPYKQLNIVECELFYSGGMEYPAIVFLDSNYLKFESSTRSLAHEVGHQWFYNLIGNNQITESWLDEGLTMMMQEGIFHDDESLHNKMQQDYKLLEDRLKNKKNTNLTQNLGSFESWSDYYDIEYLRAKFMFYSLKLKIGQEKFSTLVNECSTRYSFKIITRAEFIALAEEIHGGSLQDFFNSWFYEKELPPLQ